MSLPHLSLADARNLHLAAQGLLNKPRRRASLEDIPATISRMSLLQIDTINIVARSPYLVLFIVWEIILPSGWMSLWRVAN